jgi:hypothetical protein
MAQKFSTFMGIVIKKNEHQINAYIAATKGKCMHVIVAS